MFVHQVKVKGGDWGLSDTGGSGNFSVINDDDTMGDALDVGFRCVRRVGARRVFSAHNRPQDFPSFANRGR